MTQESQPKITRMVQRPVEPNWQLMNQLGRRRFIGGVAGGTAMAAFLAACGGGDDASPASTESGGGGGDATTVPGTSGGSASTKDTITVAAGATPPELDWDTSFAGEATQSYNNLYETALRWKRVPFEAAGPGATTPDYSVVEPQLAEDFEFSPDGKKLVLRFRKGVLSHAGNELTAEDFLYTRQRTLGTKGISTLVFSSQGLKSEANFKILDKYTIETTIDTPNPLLLWCNTNIFFNILDKKEMEKNATADDPWSKEFMRNNSAGFGPYKLESLEPGSGMTWVRHENYWQGPAPIERIIHREVPESANRLALLLSGEVDIAEHLSPREYENLPGGGQPYPAFFAGPSYNIVQFNVAKSPMSDNKFRQALSYAFPYDDVINAVYFKRFSRMTAPIPDIIPGYGDITPYSTDLDKAKALLQEAGIAEGTKVSMMVNTTQSDAEQASLLFRDNLAQIGIDLTLEKVPQSAFYDRQAAGEFDLLMYRDGGPIVADINYALQLYFFTKSETRQCCNFTGYSNTANDDYVLAGAQVVDLQERIDYHQKAMDQVLQDAPWIFVSNAGFQVGLGANIRGAAFEPPEGMRFFYMSVG